MTIITGVGIIFIVIFDLLMTCQIIPYIIDMEYIFFILTVVIRYGIES
jgi:hypothetical protein